MNESDPEVETESEKLFEKEVVNASEVTSPEKIKFVRLPLARVKHIMKMDPDIHIISKDALLLVTKSTVSPKSKMSPINQIKSLGIISGVPCKGNS